MRFLKWPSISDAVKINLFLGLLIFFGTSTFWDVYYDDMEETITYHVYSDQSRQPWTVHGIKAAEKKAHWLVYGLDCKVAVIEKAFDGKLVDQVRRNDGRD